MVEAINTKLKNRGVPSVSVYFKLLIARDLLRDKFEQYCKDNELQSSWLEPQLKDSTCKEQNSHPIYKAFDLTKTKTVSVRMEPELINHIIKKADKDGVKPPVIMMQLVMHDLSCNILKPWLMSALNSKQFDIWWWRSYNEKRRSLTFKEESLLDTEYNLMDYGLLLDKSRNTSKIIDLNNDKLPSNRAPKEHDTSIEGNFDDLKQP